MSSVSRVTAAAAVGCLALAMNAAVAFALGAGGVKANNGGGGDLSPDGGHLALVSSSTNLTPEALNGNASPYLRDLGSGVVGIVTSVGGSEPDVSEDARFVAFSLLGSEANVYVRDRQAGATVLASRANGPNGAPADQEYGFMRPSISRNGRYVAFQSTPSLDPADTDAIPDIYVRDLLTDTTTLVSRASGANGAKGDDRSEGPSISGDGRFVAFETQASNLHPDDADRTRDIHLRDLQTNTTTLVSRPSVTGFDGDNFHPDITPDGRFVAWDSKATDLAFGDDDGGTEDIYVRNLQAQTTVLASPGTGQERAEFPAVSADGNRVAFHTRAQLVPEDTDGSFPFEDVYLRNIQAGTTTLVSRASGVAGADALGYFASISDDGRFVAFYTTARNLSPDDTDDLTDTYVRDMQDNITSLESRATPGYERYVRPKGATPMRLSLVPAFAACAAPNRTHGPPLAFPSCSPPQPLSPNIAVSQGDARLRSVGSVRLDLLVGNPFTPADEADVAISFSLTNVLNAGDFSDYTGELRGSIQARLTDRINGSPPVEEGTMGDFAFEFTVPCAATASALDGATCTLNTTADAVVPGYASEGSRAVYGLGQVRVFDGGPDGDADTPADNSPFAVQGIFVP